jgi:hypothetical protein
MASSTPEEAPASEPDPTSEEELPADPEPDIAAELFGGERQPDEDCERWSDALLEQYRLYVEMADNISQRRHQTNAFFLTVNLALVTALSTLATGDGSAAIGSGGIVIVAIAGIGFSYFWRRLVRSYRQLNTGKFEVVHELEARLPARLYDAEWTALGRGEEPEKYTPLTHTEEDVPLVFAVLYGFIGLLALVQLWASSGIL